MLSVSSSVQLNVKDEPAETQSIRITKVYSEFDDLKNATKGQFKALKIRTPVELNEMTTGRSTQVFVKRLGNTTIAKRTVATQPNVAETSEWRQVRLPNGKQQIMKLSKKPHPQPQAQPQTIRPLESHLLIENQELKKMLVDCRRDIIQMECRLKQMTSEITTLLTKSTAKSSSVQFVTRKLVQTRSVDPTFKAPLFPIKEMKTLRQLDLDLLNRQYRNLVFQKIMSRNSQTKFEKPAEMLGMCYSSVYLI